MNAEQLKQEVRYLLLKEITTQNTQNKQQKGNECFRNQKYDKAIELYTKSLEINDNDYTLWANRAMAHLKLKNFESAEFDATKSLKINPNFVKSLLRRGNF